MFLTPKYPETPAIRTAQVITPAAAPTQHAHVPVCACQHAQPTIPARRIAPALGVGAGAVAAVITVGVVLTALVTAVAVAAISVAVAAVVLRSLLTSPRHR